MGEKELEIVKEELMLEGGKKVGVVGVMISGEELMDFLKGEQVVDMRSGKYTGEKKCIGPIPDKKTCQNKLTPCQNFNNCYCWNCIVDYLRNKGRNAEADELAEKYL